jgi:hypothetical protein
MPAVAAEPNRSADRMCARLISMLGMMGYDTTMTRNLRPCTLAIAMLFGLTGCSFLPSHTPVLEVPSISGPFASITVVRKGQLSGSGPTHYISLDGVTIAALEVGEYTTFHLSEGHHTLALIRHVVDTHIAHFIFWESRPHLQFVELDSHSSMNYFFTITDMGFLSADKDRVEFKQVELLEVEFAPERNKYVPPGPH